MIVATANSTYYLDTEAKTWARIDKTGDSGNLRNEQGVYNEIAQLEEGKNMLLVCPPAREDAIARLIITSPVLTITNSDKSN